uniref:Uncharacterized protein n=1 Tax=Tanacetum cinerariifolium TaxID=118510 RepID=A0A6L2NXL4_TANCI|nr:hypothetical protein [Tanacetum cinerariifolium]
MNLWLNKSRPYQRRRRRHPVTAKRGRFKVMMHLGKLHRQQREKLSWLKAGLPFLKAASMVTRGGKLAFENLTTKGRDKARAVGKNKGSKASGSSSVNEDALAKLMITEMTTQEKEQRKKFLEIKRGEVECREREIATHEYR